MNTAGTEFLLNKFFHYHFDVDGFVLNLYGRRNNLLWLYFQSIVNVQL